MRNKTVITVLFDSNMNYIVSYYNEWNRTPVMCYQSKYWTCCMSSCVIVHASLKTLYCFKAEITLFIYHKFLYFHPLYIALHTTVYDALTDCTVQWPVNDPNQMFEVHSKLPSSRWYGDWQVAWLAHRSSVEKHIVFPCKIFSISHSLSLINMDGYLSAFHSCLVLIKEE